jgi:hypothetical protein
MENELTLQQVKIVQGSISFNNYESLKEEALELSEKVSSIIVNEENVKDMKKLIAAVNKKVKELDSNRIKVKKMMLEPYVTFEEKVKEIVSIVDESEEVVRKQIRELEEKEKEEKRQNLEEIFNKRIALYPFKDLITFSDFLKPSHLNKSTSFNSVEQEMVDYLEKISNDFEVMRNMDNFESLVSYYLDSKDLTKTLSRANEVKQREQKIKTSELVSEEPSKKIFHITLYEEKDFLLVKMFLEQNKINFTY